MTMIENARNNGLEPLSYMKWVLSDAYKGNADHMFDSPEVPDLCIRPTEGRNPGAGRRPLPDKAVKKRNHLTMVAHKASGVK